MEYYFTLANTAAEKQNYYFTSFGQLTNIRPKVIMWVKGNLFMENGNYEDLRQPNEAQNSTIFDDVFRTIAQKMPFLLIPLINEVFGTEYSDKQEFEQLRNEHYEKFGKVVTDSIIRIGGHLYHIECQSGRDGSMAVRMIEYDFAIALERYSQSGSDMDVDILENAPCPQPDGSEQRIMEITFPESCVLYIRNHKNMPKQHKVRVRFADGQSIVYSVPVILAQDYTVDRIFEKRLLILLPYHILRYESFLKSNGTNEQKMEQLLADYQEINGRLSALQDGEEKAQLYVDLIELINRIADYVIPGDNPSRERIGDVMGGQILVLRSERLREEGREEGRAEGRMEGRAEGRILELCSMVQDGDISPERAAKRLGITVPDLEQKMMVSGYRYPKP